MSTTPDDVAPDPAAPDEAPAPTAELQPEETAPPPLRFYQRPSLRRILWLTLFILAFFGIGLLLPPNFWRF